MYNVYILSYGFTKFKKRASPKNNKVVTSTYIRNDLSSFNDKSNRNRFWISCYEKNYHDSNMKTRQSCTVCKFWKPVL